MNTKSYNKKGFTLVELIVAMAIFLVVITLAVGAFVTVSRMKSLTSTAKEVQQKTRIATEMITRLSRQADKVIIGSDEKSVDLYFNLKTSPYGTRFAIENTSSGNTGLNVYECASSNCTSNWGTASNLLGDSVKLNAESLFKKTGTIPPRLQIRLIGEITDINNSPYYSSEFTIDTDVILEGIK